MPSQPENFFQFEELLVALTKSGVDFAAVGGVAVEKDQLDVFALKQIVGGGEGKA